MKNEIVWSRTKPFEREGGRTNSGEREGRI